MNIKITLNPKLKRKTIVKLDESSSQEDTESKEMEEVLSQAIENIEECIKLILELPIKEYVYKGKGVIPYCKEVTNLNPVDIKQKKRSVDDQILKYNLEFQKNCVNES